MDAEQSHRFPVAVVAVTAIWAKFDASCRLLVTRRAPGSHLEGYWELPGGKVNEGENPPDAARRELLEETGLSAPDLDCLAVIRHEYPEQIVELHLFAGVLDSVSRSLPHPLTEVLATREHRWVMRDEFDDIDFPPANASFHSTLRNRWPRPRPSA